MTGAVHNGVNLAFNISLSVTLRVLGEGIINKNFIHALGVDGLHWGIFRE